MTGMLAGKVVVITGAGRGLGRAYALAAAAQGAAVVVNDIDSETAGATAALIEAAGGQADAVVGSTADADFAEALIARTVDRFGSVDGVVANAGVMRSSSPYEETAENVEFHLRVNVLGVFNVVDPALRVMRDQRSGSIVLVTSGARTGLPRIAAYAASKGAVASMCLSLAASTHQDGIRVNAISPVANTGMFGAAVSALAPPPEPEAIAPVVTYLLSDLSRSITGQIVRFTGSTLGLYPSPVDLAGDVTRESWTAEQIDAEIRGSLASAIADVSAGEDLVQVPLEQTDRDD